MYPRIVVIATMTIYIATGIKIYKKGAGLRFFMNSSRHTSDHRDSAIVEEPTANPFAGGKSIVVTTQIQHDIHEQDHGSRPVSYEGDQGSLSSVSSINNLPKTGYREDADATTSSDDLRVSRVSHDFRTSTYTRNGTQPHTGEESMTGYKATAFATKQFEGLPPLPPRPSSAATHHRSFHIKRAAGNDVAVAYLKVAFLMFIALFVVWVPSTINRLYQFIHKDQPNYALNILSAIVLPLQGAWNATIYIYTTRAECKKTYVMIKSRMTGKAAPYHPPQDSYRKDTSTSSRGTRDSGNVIQLEEGLYRGDYHREPKT